LALLFVGLLTYACNLVNIAIMTPCASFDLPSQHGKTFLITGASSGLGLETARVLALKGGKVIMGCRSRHKCEEAKKQAQIASLDVHCEDVELSSQASVRSFAAVIIEKYGGGGDEGGGIDVLINNAGLMNVSPFQKTEDGLEMTMGVNHFSHFLLTQLLLPHIREHGRIVTHSSLAAFMSFDKVGMRDTFPFKYLPLPQSWFTGYDGWAVYGHSKLANALMSWELNKRLAVSTNPTYQTIRSYVVAPGYTDTNLQKEAHMYGWELGNSAIAMRVQDGAQSQLVAAAGDIEPFKSSGAKIDVMVQPVANLWGYPAAKRTGLYVFCSIGLLSFLVCDGVSVTLLSIYCSLLAFSDTT
jgi:NAD(P)-dependent dehydrogenase (short-subunit alcohol dehydrogenase family)